MAPARRGFSRGEGAAREQRPHDQVRDGDGACGARNGEQQCQLDAARLRQSRTALVAGREPPRHFRQQHRAHGDADDPDGQLVDAVGVIERGERTGWQIGRDHRIGEQRELHAARANDGGARAP